MVKTVVAGIVGGIGELRLQSASKTAFIFPSLLMTADRIPCPQSPDQPSTSVAVSLMRVASGLVGFTTVPDILG